MGRKMEKSLQCGSNVAEIIPLSVFS